jgi:hypothetical protein
VHNLNLKTLMQEHVFTGTAVVGGTDGGEFSRQVYVNGSGPSGDFRRTF